MRKYVTYGAMFLALALVEDTLGADGKQKSADSRPSAAPTYEILDRDTYDAPIKSQIELHAIVSGIVTESSLKQLLQKLYAEANGTRGFKYDGGKPTHVFIYLYTSRDHYKSGAGQWIAMLSRIGESAQVTTQIKRELVEQMASGPEVKHDLSEAKRKEIFRAIVTAENRADADAQRMYPLPDPSRPGYSQSTASAQMMQQAEALNALTAKYKSEIADRYGIMEEQLRQITVEGITKNWPIP